MTINSRLTLKISKIMIGLFLCIGLAWVVWTQIIHTEWVTYTYPHNGDKNIPLLDTIIIQWEQEEGDIGFQIEYVDDPSSPILGVTSGSKDGMSFMPEGLLPNKKVKVSLSSGLRSYSFVFTTAEEADRRVDAYGAILAHFFRSPQHGQPPEVVALDISTVKAWPRRDQDELLKSLSAFHSTIVYGTVKEGFQPLGDLKSEVPLEDQNAMLLRIDKQKDEFGIYELAIQLQRGKGVLKGIQGSTSTFVYSSQYQNGKWQINPLREKESIRPWGNNR